MKKSTLSHPRTKKQFSFAKFTHPAEDPPTRVDLTSEAINLKNCGAGDEVIIRLCMALRSNQIVMDLNLSGNEITDEGAAAIGDMIHRNRCIKYLDLCCNQIGDEGVRSLALALRTNKTLAVISLSSNPFGDRGIVNLASGLRFNTSVRELVLLDNQITYEGALQMSEGLLENSTLLYLTLPYTLGYRLINEIQKILRRNWLAASNAKEQFKEYKKQADSDREREMRVQMQWKKSKSEKPAEKEKDANVIAAQTPSIYPESARCGQVDTWKDPAMGVTMMYLNLLDKKRPKKGRRAL